MMARYCVGLVASIRHTADPPGAWMVATSDKGPSKVKSDASSSGAPMRLIRTARVWGPRGVFLVGAMLVHFNITSCGAVPGHSMVMPERSGGVEGGITTQATVLAGDRAASVPRRGSSADQATALYQTRFQDPGGVSFPLATVICSPRASLIRSTCQPGVMASKVSTGGPMVSRSLAASSTRTRWRSMRRTRGPLRVSIRILER